MNSLNYIDALESEAIFVFREVAAQFKKPVILFSGGKDSIVLIHLARKAFFPANIPFDIVHIDTGHNFDETIEYRNNLIKKYKLNLTVGSVQEAINNNIVKEEEGYYASRNKLQTIVLKNLLVKEGVDAAIGGARRDEEKSRAKERFFSHRDSAGNWIPKNQRPELWNLYNGKKLSGEHFRVFPISNWTEIDIWEYIEREKIELPSLYFSHEREVFLRDGVLMAKSPFIKMKPEEVASKQDVRCRTIGDITCTGLTRSNATNVKEVILELLESTSAERGLRTDDKLSETAMEDRKKEGYF
jgi:sulfate adenylyltransferase subunit 2